MADARVEALRSSVARLGGLASTMADADLTRPAYPADWKIADVLSHIGSGAIIMLRRLEDTLAGTDTPDDLAADAALLERIDRVTDRERDRFSMGMGPMSLDFDAFVGMRLNEHAFHTWDIEVVVDPAATIPEPVAAVVVDNLEMIARYTAKPSGDTATITVATTKPPRRFTVALTPESVTFTPTTAEAAADLDLTAEAFARLVYGRLDPRHTPRNDDDPGLDKLRRVFPGP
jgi:uncharacterized protein (TIGR03083 family)